MAKFKRNKNGYFMKSFTFQGKRYYVYDKDSVDKLFEKVAQKKKELEEGYTKQINPTLESYYDYLTSIRIHELKGSTIRAQRFQFNNIADVEIRENVKFGSLRIGEIKRRDIEQARLILLEAGKTPEYLNIAFKHLHYILERAVLDETLKTNPCKGLKPLKRNNDPISENRHRALSEKEVACFLEKSEERKSFYHNIFKFMLLTGLRIGEVGALFLTDIDSEFIHVRRTITRSEIGTYEIGRDTKTYSGKRDIPLTSELKKLIKEQRELNNMMFGTEWTGTLFKSSEGMILREYTINREIKRVCRDADIPYFTCHGFRVTFATRFIEQRPQDYKVLSELMGHKNIKITLDLYTRVMQNSKILAMNEVKIIKTS